MRAVTVDGQDVEAVYRATIEALAHAREGHGPVFLHVITYRLTGHYIGDPQVYRDKDELARLRETEDPVTKLRERLGLSDEEFEQLDREATSSWRPRSSSRRRAPTRSPRTRSRTSMPELSYREAVRDALSRAMREDENVFIMGEDIAEMGGSMGVTQGMLDEFGPERVRNTPISEMALVGAGIGAAMQGMRPVVEIMYEDFLTLSAEQIVNQAAKHRYMSGGQLKVPLTVRTQGGAGWSPGAQHAQQLEAWFAHIPGLKVVFASTPNDVRGLLWSSIYDDNPVVFFEHRTLYGLKEDVPEELEPIELGKARVHREGTDVTVVATGRLVHEALAAAEEAEADGDLGRGRRPAHAAAARRGGDRRLGQEDEPLRRRARGGDEDGLRRRDRGRRPVPGLRLPRRADRARRREVRAAAVRAGDGGVRRPARQRRPRGGQAHGTAVATEIKLPRLGQGMEAGTIVRWLKSEGEQVREGRAALRARHGQGDAGGRGRRLRRPAADRRRRGRGPGRADDRRDRRGGRGGLGVSEQPAPSRRRVEPQEEGSRGAGARRGARARAGGLDERLRAGDGDQPEPAAGRRPRQGVAARAPDRARARDRPRVAARHRPGGPDRGRGRRARGHRAGRGGRRRSHRRGRARPADLAAQDDRAPHDRGLAGAGLPDLDVGRHDARRRAARAAARARRRGRCAAELQRHPDQGLRGRADAPPRRQRALRRTTRSSCFRARTSASPSPSRTASSSRSSAPAR